MGGLNNIEILFTIPLTYDYLIQKSNDLYKFLLTFLIEYKDGNSEMNLPYSLYSIINYYNSHYNDKDYKFMVFKVWKSLLQYEHFYDNDILEYNSFLRSKFLDAIR